MLMKSAYTEITASIIDGKMTLTISCFSQKTSAAMSNETKAKLQEFWRYIWYLVIDEVSMISKTFLALLSQNVGIGVAGSGPDQVNYSFGRINIILCRDFHQFPPVSAPASEALYQPIGTHNSTESQLGQKIYEEFTTVVLLKEQMQVTDPGWRDFLEHLREGRVQNHHIHSHAAGTHRWTPKGTTYQL